MEIYVYSRRGLEAAKPHEVPHFIISITSVSTDLATVHQNPHTLGLLRLAFPDYEEPSEAFPESELFSSDQASRIWGFVLQHRAAAQRAIVHCEAGISRSAAVAAALRHVLGGDETEFFSGAVLAERAGLPALARVGASPSGVAAPGPGTRTAPEASRARSSRATDSAHPRCAQRRPSAGAPSAPRSCRGGP